MQMCGIASMGALACIRHSFALENNSTADANRVVSFCPLLATATMVVSTMPVPTASTGRVRSTLAIPTARGASTSILAIAAWATSTVSSGDPFALFASPRTKKEFTNLELRFTICSGAMHCATIILKI